MTDPLRDHAAAQPGIATYPAALRAGTPPARPWVPLRDLVLRSDAEPATQPATIAAAERTDPPEGERTDAGTAEGSQTISADHPRSQAPGTAETAAEQGKPSAEIHVPGRPGHRVRVWETVGAGWIWSCSQCDARGTHLADQTAAFTAAIRHARGPLPWWRRAIDRITRTDRKDHR